LLALVIISISGFLRMRGNPAPRTPPQSMELPVER
jgi:hypothetical protein